ncbi:hypothetical protein WICMUC_005588 [Wickerhamomyces mucosus]|uniref:Methyltransferase type 11 domain-containing protein n=1 Tax=Wickerhamomyces mucosus TaxID=1378264 RepID=A0A9P8T5R6_9ASCO|nr:hypothetical protein WICMUC_005588 [Wickerhamomyces mucosus]
MSVNQVSLTSFNSNHKLYDQVRPSFQESIANKFFQDLDLDKSNKVIELAAGTGKFTKNLVEYQKHSEFELFIVEPSSGMLTTFKENYPELKTYENSSYDLPFEDNSIDLIIAAQAFHWFADEKSLKEFKRVLKPNGKLGLIWNFSSFQPENNKNLLDLKINTDKIDSKYWDKINEQVSDYDGEVPQYRKAEWRKVFKQSNYFDYSSAKDGYEIFQLDFPISQTFDSWLSRSYITALPNSEKEKLKSKLSNVVTTFPDEAYTDSTKEFLKTNYGIFLKFNFPDDWIVNRSVFNLLISNLLKFKVVDNSKYLKIPEATSSSCPSSEFLNFCNSIFLISTLIVFKEPFCVNDVSKSISMSPNS